MNTKQRTLAIAGAGIAAAAALGITGATLANAAGETSASAATSTSSVFSGPGPVGGLRDAGGTLTADAASKAVAAAAASLDGGTVNGVRALSDGTFVVHGTKSDGTHVHVLLDKAFAVTSTQEGGMGRGGPGGPGGDDPSGATPPDGTSTPTPSGSATSTTSLPTT